MGSSAASNNVELFLTDAEMNFLEIRESKGGQKICTLKPGLAVVADADVAVLSGSDFVSALADDASAVTALYSLISPLLPPAVDRFATLNATTITFPDGSTVDVGQGAVYNAAANALTLGDGTVVPLAVDTDTDTDTFATFNAGTQTITFADGSALLIEPDEFLTFVDNGNGTATFTASLGGQSITVLTQAPAGGSDTFSTLEDNTITFPDGSTIDVPAASTFDGDTNTLTLPDGVEVNLNTLVTFDPIGRRIRFPSGQTVVVEPDTDTFVTIADNGDGSATVTNVDGSTVLVPVYDPDALQFVAQMTLVVTMADGSVVNIASGSAFDAATGEFTLPDGSTVALDAGSTFDPATGVITLPDGVRVNLSNGVTGFVVIVDNGDGTATATNVDGSTVNLVTA